MLTNKDRDQHGSNLLVMNRESLIGVVVYTEQVDDVIRIISARKATKNEVRRYEKSIKN